MTYALIAALGIACLSLIGALFFHERANTEPLHRFVLPVAVGIFLGVVFFELIPETLHASEFWGPITILTGFLGFYLLSHMLDTYHHHHTNEHDGCARGGARRLLIGDAVHNFADGVVIATSFMVHPTLGFLATAGIALHEIPQEIAEYAVLRASCYSRRRALTLNFLSAMTVVLGVVLTFILGGFMHEFLFILTGIAAGNLLYIATSDLIPELRHSHREHFLKVFGATVFGVVLIGSIITAVHERVGHGAHEEDEHGRESEEIHTSQTHLE
jgi:zinc and cadmium transporter